ncbi:bifunctional acetate--CoA ligase family protein/GNAT family N-acetyltransferase [Marivibrio halodurans]|uniref:Bifunctional acetate--CoA ligase family protein/GNAT family N-acetyltransferase n=1 Tax=Marivibrio halodurans TaxID=2039722 RepID=A0A8J7S1S4_9PROT|nr:bifunctional acetate--CoA ligase family protein/GNAT family N-acetyltransferase [Marivibrio halodurans]MBP5858767.1 bifunctional acetate--CoA ligase family protein/GNAT family N-acetyltransferase [Marivibrio halodurans]
MSLRDLDSFFHPKSIALVGASNRDGSVGAVLAQNLMTGGFEGPIMPVNPKYRSIGGVYAWPDIDSLPEAPELAVVATPADAVAGVIGELRAKGCKAACIITAGFGEGAADAEGRARRAAVLEAAGPMRLLGPNVLGLMMPETGINASFAHIAPPKGDLAFVSQSGAMLTSVLDWASGQGIGFSHLISLGDMIDVDFADLLNHLTRDTSVRAILLYIEAIGDARKFMSAARAAARTKPVVIIKAGRFAEGAKAATSHTGALAGADGVYDAAFRRAGMLRVYDMQELFDAVQTLSSSLRRLGIQGPRGEGGDRLAILTNGGGIGVLATDSLMQLGGRLAPLDEKTIQALDGVLPPTWSHGNPVDIIGDASGARYVAALDALLKDETSDAVLVINCPQAISNSREAAEAVIAALPGQHKPVLTNWLGDEAARAARKRFAEARIPTYNTAEEAVRAFMHVVRYGRNQAMLMQAPAADSLDGREPDRAAVRAIIDDALAEGRAWLSEVEAKNVLDAYSIPVARTYCARDAEEAYWIARGFKMGDLVAVKVLSRDITHKSDVGGVVLNLTTPEQVREATEQMLTRLHRDYPDAVIEGVSVQEMISRPGAHELIVGLNEDPQFGPVVLFGRGGKEVEVIGDTATGLPPLNDVLAEGLIEETAVYRLLKGFRDTPPSDLPAIRRALIRVGQLAIDFAEVKELDINPLIADADGVVALDARIRIAADDRPARERLAIRPYPRELEGEVSPRDGDPIRLRPVRPEDKDALMELVDRCDAEDIRFRFLHPMKRLPDQLAARLSQIDYAREMAFVALVHEDDPAEHIAGVVRLFADADLETAEYAILLRRDLKGKGLGYALMQRLIDYARGVGIGLLHGDVLSDNRPMLDLCADLGFEAREQADDPGVTRVSLDLDAAAGRTPAKLPAPADAE